MPGMTNGVMASIASAPRRDELPVQEVGNRQAQSDGERGCRGCVEEVFAIVCTELGCSNST